MNFEKRGVNPNIHLQIKEKKWEFKKKENEILNKNERLSVFCQIINGRPSLYTLKSEIPTLPSLISTKDYITSNYWR